VSSPASCDVAVLVHHEVGHDGRVLRECASLAEGGWRVEVLALSLAGDPPPAVPPEAGFAVHTISPRLGRARLPGTYGKLLRLGLALPALRRLLRRSGARVVHAHDFPGLLMAAICARRGTAVIYDSRELFFDQWPPGVDYPLKHVIHRLRPLERRLARRAAAVVSASEGYAERMAQALGIPRPVVVRNTVHPREATAEPAVRLPGEGRRRLVHTGGLVHGRHLEELVAAVASMPPDVVLVLLGDGPLLPSLRRIAAEAGTADRLLVVPPVPAEKVAATIRPADAAVVLVTSGAQYDHALPNKICEAVAAGLPVVSSPTAAATRVVAGWDLGVLCDPRDPAQIASAVARVLDPGSHPRYRANVQRAWREDLNWDVDAAALLAVYDRLDVRPGGVPSRG
jgi:glycogen(starch) synthase